MAAFTTADMTKDSLTHVAFEPSKHDNIAFEEKMKINFTINSAMDKVQAIGMAAENQNMRVGYGFGSGSGGYVAIAGERESSVYGGINQYKTDVKYKSGAQYRGSVL